MDFPSHLMCIYCIKRGLSSQLHVRKPCRVIRFSAVLRTVLQDVVFFQVIVQDSAASETQGRKRLNEGEGAKECAPVYV